MNRVPMKGCDTISSAFPSDDHWKFEKKKLPFFLIASLKIENPTARVCLMCDVCTVRGTRADVRVRDGRDI